MAPATKSHTLQALEKQIDDHVAEGADAVKILSGLVRRFSERYPEVAEAFPVDGGPVCRCRQLFPALNNLRCQGHIQSNKEVRVSLDRALMEGGVTSARDARARGVKVSNRRWAEAKGDVEVKPVGRPSKVDDMKLVRAAGEVLAANSHETADVVAVRNPVSKMVEHVYKRVRNCSWYSMFMASALLISMMSFPTFQLIRKKYYGFLRKGQRKTDVCDHCALFENQVLPGFWLDVRRCRELLEHLWPKYFTEFDARKKVQRAEVDIPAKYCEMLLVHIGGFIDAHRPELPIELVGDLHRAAAKALDLLRWHLRLLKSHAWHRR